MIRKHFYVNTFKAVLLQFTPLILIAGLSAMILLTTANAKNSKVNEGGIEIRGKIKTAEIASITGPVQPDPPDPPDPSPSPPPPKKKS
jgi:hypothetical protein